MREIKLNMDVYHIPSEWDELTIDQLTFLIRITKEDTPIQQIKLYMLLYCLKARVFKKMGLDFNEAYIKIGKREYYLTTNQLTTLADLFDFLLVETKDGEYNINPGLRKNPFPTFRKGLKRYYGPTPCLYDASYEQFVLAQAWQEQMNEDPDAIHYLLASIWHRGKEFNPEKVERDAKAFRSLSMEKKTIMFWFWLGSLSELSERFFRVFSGNGSSSGNVYESQLRVIDALAGSDMTKKPAIRKGLLLDALFSMDETVRKQEDLRKE